MFEGSKSSTHYLSDTKRFDVSSKGPSSGINQCLHAEILCLLEYIFIIQALIQQEKDLAEQIKDLQSQLQQTVPDKNHLKQLEQKVKELEKGLHVLQDVKNSVWR